MSTKKTAKQEKQMYKFKKRNGIEYAGELVKEKEYSGINYFFLKDETGKIHQINPKNAIAI